MGKPKRTYPHSVSPSGRPPVKTEKKKPDKTGQTSISKLAREWPGMEEEKGLSTFFSLNRQHRAELISELGPADQEKLITSLSTQSMRELMGNVDPDDLVDLVQSLRPEIRNKVLRNLSPDNRSEIDFLLRFDDDDAAGLMTTRYAAIRGELTVAQALSFIRRAPENLETIYYIYVVDGLKRLNGVVSLRQILISPDTQRIDSIMENHVISVLHNTNQEETAQVLENHDFLAIPVVDRWNMLLGIVTVDDVIDVIQESHQKDVYRMGAISAEAGDYLSTPVYRLIWERLPWLTLLLLAGTITTNIIARYHWIITRFAVLAFFIPVMTQTGGNSGVQSSTLMIRGLSTGNLNLQQLGRVVIRELLTGLLLGGAAGLVIFLRSMFLPPGVGPGLAGIVAASLLAVVVFATIVGCLIPFLIMRMGGDPAVAAGPLISTIIDIAGLSLYFEVSRLLLPVSAQIAGPG